MRALIAILVCLVGVAWAGETPEQVKAKRVAKVKMDLQEVEKAAQANRVAVENYTKQGKPERAERRAKQLADNLILVAALKLELRWLTGELTLAQATAAVKTTEAAVEKAVAAKTDEKTMAPLNAALTAAKAELEAVKKWEAAKDF